MKNFLIAILASTVFTCGAIAQDPTKSVTVQEANQLNGNAQPTMKGGKSYSQWVAEEKAKRQAQQNKVTPAQNTNTDIISVNAADARPTPAKPVPVVDASITAKKVDAVSKPLPQVPEQFKLAVGQTWNANVAPQKMGETNTLPAGVKLETIEVAAESKPTESKPAELKTQPVAIPNLPNATKAKTN